MVGVEPSVQALITARNAPGMPGILSSRMSTSGVDGFVASQIHPLRLEK
jgi:hypothetical protein